MNNMTNTNNYFTDPITLNRYHKRNGIMLNKQWYSKTALSKLVRSSQQWLVPHSRRKLTNAEIMQFAPYLYAPRKKAPTPRRIPSNAKPVRRLF